MKKHKIETVKMQQFEPGRICDAGVFPKAVLLDTVSFCNLRCSMCVHKNMKREKGIMSWEIFTKVIDEIAETNINTRVWMIFFGEALLLKNKKPSIFDMIGYAKSKGLKDIVLNSNANLLDAKTGRRLIESGLDAIYIGIDAFTPETYSKIRVGGDYKKVVENTLNLLRLKNTLKSSKPDIFVQFVEMDINKKEKDDFMCFWKKNGAKVKIRPKVSWSGSIEAPNLVLDNEDRWPCHWAMQTMSITSFGKVVTCAVDLDARFIAGDITKSSIREIWNNDLKILRELHVSRRFDKLPENCRNCKDWQSAKADYY
jgi:radical SAM protein with 4Fe4S-binding SPASM domain